MKKIYVLFSVLLFASFASTSFAVSPYFFKGYVYLNGSLAPNGTIVEAYINSASSAAGSVVVGSGQLADTRPGWYTIPFEASSGDSVAFRVNNLSLNSANGTNTSAQTISNIVTENFNLSANTSADGSSCLYNSTCANNLCVHVVCRSSNPYCGDTYCDSGETCTSCSGDCGACASSGGSGGGGGGGGGASTTSETVSIPSIAAGVIASFPISSSVSANIGVEKIELTPTTAASNVQITVKETTAADANVAVAVSVSEGAVYKYLEITKSNISDSSISSAKVSFKVPKNWLTSNKIDKNTVALSRYSNGWTKLATSIRSEDSTYVFYTADTPGFSTFAVTGKKGIAFFDLISRIDDYYKGKLKFFDLIDSIDLYYNSQG